MRLLTLGRASEVQDALADAAAARPAIRILEIGCGTGALTARLVERGAEVTAVDQNPEMLDQARARLQGRDGNVLWVEKTASEIGALEGGNFEAVASSFCLSEMSRMERRYVLKQACASLAPGGVVALADEVNPARRWQRVLHGLLRAPQVLAAWLLTGSLSQPVDDLAAEMREAGLQIVEERRWLAGRFALFVAKAAATAEAGASTEAETGAAANAEIGAGAEAEAGTSAQAPARRT